MPKLLLPPFDLLVRQNDPPNNASTIASSVVANEYGKPIRYQLQSNRKGTSYWLSAVYWNVEGREGPYGRRVHSEGRASGTLSTTSKTKADRWHQAVEAGNVAVGEDGDTFGGHMGRIDVTKHFRRERRYAPKACAAGSFRAKKNRSGTLLTFCCPRGKWQPRKQRCKVAMKLQSIGRPR